MYWKRTLTLLAIAGGTVGLAASIERYKPHARPAAATGLRVYTPDGRAIILTDKDVSRLIRTQAVPLQLPADPVLLRTKLQSIFGATTQIADFAVQQNDAQFYVAGFKIPFSSEQRVLVYLVQLKAENQPVFVLIADFAAPSDKPIKGARLERGQLVFSNDDGDLLTQPFDVP